MRIKAFTGLRPPKDLAPTLASPPYDVVDSAEARELAKGRPESFLHINKPEIDLPEDISVYDDQVYAKAAENLRRFVDEGYLATPPSPVMYLYRQAIGDHEQYGLVCVSHVDDYNDDLIKKHEKTKQYAEDDRTRHVSTLSANAGPVFLTYRDSSEVSELLKDAADGEPLYDFSADDGVRHTAWEIADASAIEQAFKAIPATYVADGHHRAASAARVGRERREANPNHTGNEDYNWFLTVLFPASHLNVLAYNRAVKDLNGRDAESFLDEVKKSFTVEPGANPSPDSPSECAMYLAGTWYRLTWEEKTDDPVESLAVSVLQQNLLDPVLGIEDPRTNPRISFVGGIKGTAGLERLVDSGKAAVAFSMYPTTVERLMNVADAGRCMPPKSTWFEPKLRSGLFLHTF